MHQYVFALYPSLFLLRGVRSNLQRNATLMCKVSAQIPKAFNQHGITRNYLSLNASSEFVKLQVCDLIWIINNTGI